MVKQNGLTLIALDYLEFRQDFLCKTTLFLHEFHTIGIVPIKMKFGLIYDKNSLWRGVGWTQLIDK